jgi:hypothetical protein
MALKPENITVERDGVRIVDLRVTDVVTTEWLKSVPAERRVDAARNALQLGARVLSYEHDRLGTNVLCERIDASAESASRLLATLSKSTSASIQASIDAALGKSGTVAKCVAAQLNALELELAARLDPEKATSITGRLSAAIVKGVETEVARMKSAVDLANPNSPLAQFHAELLKRFDTLGARVDELVTQSAVTRAVAIERARGTHKGTTFEGAVHEALGELCRHRQDQLERTTSETGLVGRRKRGDFTVEINAREAGGPGLRVVVETKNDQTKRSELLREMDEALENRGAAFAIGVSTSAALLPPGSPPIDFVSDTKLLVYVGDFDEKAGFDWLYLEVALAIARFAAILTRSSEPKTMDLRRMNEYIASALASLGRFSDIKRELTSIVTTAHAARTLVDRIRSEVRDALETIRDGIDLEPSTDEAHLKSA